MKIQIFIASAAVAATMGGAASAATFVETALASGTIGADSFSDSLLTFTGIGPEPAALHNGIYSINLTSLTVSGVTTSSTPFSASFTYPAYVFSNAVDAVGFTDTQTTVDILDTITPALASYKLTTPAGPVVGTFPYANPKFAFATSDGALRLQSVDGPVTFTATGAVPEPATWAMMLVGIFAIGGTMRTNRHKGVAV